MRSYHFADSMHVTVTWPKYKYHTCNIQTSTDSFIPIWDFAVLQLRILKAMSVMWKDYMFGWMSHPAHVILPSLQAKGYVLILIKLLIPLICLNFHFFWELSRRTENFNAVQNRSGILRKISWRRYRCESRDILSWKEKKVFSCLLLMMTIPVIKFRSIGLVGYVWFVNLRF